YAAAVDRPKVRCTAILIRPAIRITRLLTLNRALRAIPWWSKRWSPVLGVGSRSAGALAISGTGSWLLTRVVVTAIASRHHVWTRTYWPMQDRLPARCLD